MTVCQLSVQEFLRRQSVHELVQPGGKLPQSARWWDEWLDYRWFEGASHTEFFQGRGLIKKGERYTKNVMMRVLWWRSKREVMLTLKKLVTGIDTHPGKLFFNIQPCTFEIIIFIWCWSLCTEGMFYIILHYPEQLFFPVTGESFPPSCRN